MHEFAKNARIIRVDIDPYNLKRDIHEDGVNEVKLQAETGAVIRCLSEKGSSVKKEFGDWLEVCREIKENLQAVDDQTPERYINRMIADLSDMLQDTSAIAVDVGIWSGAISRLRTARARNFCFPAVTELWDMDFRQLSALIMPQADLWYVSVETEPSR